MESGAGRDQGGIGFFENGKGGTAEFAQVSIDASGCHFWGTVAEWVPERVAGPFDAADADWGSGGQ